MKTKRLGLGLGAVLLGLIVAGAAVRAGRTESGAASSARSAGERRASGAAVDLGVTPQPTVPVRAWEPGARYAYGFKSSRTFRIVQAKQAQAARLELRLEGTLVLTVTSADADVVQVHAELRDARLDADGAAPPDGLDAERLRRPFFVTFERGGRVRALRFDKSVQGEARNQLKSVVASMQFVAPERPEMTDWLATEAEPAGEYVASYSCGGTLPTVRKSKLRYTRVLGADGLVPVATLGSYEVTSRGAVALEPDGWPRSVDEDETIVVGLPGHPNEYTMAAKVSATLTKVDSARELVDALARAADGLEETSFDTNDQLAAAAAQIDVNRVGGSDFRTMLAELKSLSPESRDDQTKAHGLVTRLGSLFRVDPKSAPAARDALLARPDAMTARVLVGGLSAAGTVEAQQALVAVVRATEAPLDTRVLATAGLGLSEHPTSAAMKATTEAMDSTEVDQRSAGALALGNQIRQARGADPDAAEAGLHALLAHLEGATTPSDVILYLDALGNTGDERALPSIRRYLGHDDPAIRAAANRALRFMEAPEVDPLLAGALAMDPDPRVRVAVLTAVAFRTLAPFAEAIVGALRTDPSRVVRNQALSILIRHREAVPGATEAIAWAKDNDPDPDLRAAAERAIAG